VALIALALYVLSTTGQIWFFTRREDRREAEARLERRELTDRIMALSSKPESLAAVRQEVEEATVSYTPEETPWWQEGDQG
jgi:hypothetical protein